MKRWPLGLLMLAMLPLLAAAQASPELPPDRLEKIISEPMISDRETTQARPGMGDGGMMAGGPMGRLPGYSATWYPDSNLKSQSGDFGFVRQNLNLGMPLWKTERGIVLGRFGIGHSLFSTNVILPDTQRFYPRELWNINLGLNAIHRFDNGWSGMLISGFGSASDKPFHSIREVTAQLGFILRIPTPNERDSWMLGAMYIAGGAVNFPLPILGYSWNPSDELRMNLGIPFSVMWKPMEKVTVDFSYMPLLQIDTKVTYELTSKLKLFGGYEYLNESYYLADRSIQNDRFFALEQRVLGGLRYQFGKAGTLDVNAGYAFGRRYGEGDNQWGSLRDRVDVKPGAFLGLRLGIRF